MRGTAEQRRREIGEVASRLFAERGLHGVSASTIAETAGISEAYVFRLFGSKRALFIEVVVAAFDALTDGMVAAAQGRSGTAALASMGEEYTRLLGDRDRLLLQMQGFAASGDPVVRDAVRAAFGRLWVEVAAAAALEVDRIKPFMGVGMLLTDLAALGAGDIDEPWARAAVADVPAALLALP